MGKEPIVPNMFWWDSQGNDLPTSGAFVASTCPGTLALVT